MLVFPICCVLLRYCYFSGICFLCTFELFISLLRQNLWTRCGSPLFDKSRSLTCSSVSFCLKSALFSISTLTFHISCLYRKIHSLPNTVKPLGGLNVCTGLDQQSILLTMHSQASCVVTKKFLSIGQACVPSSVWWSVAQAVSEAERASSQMLAMACGKDGMHAVPCPPVVLSLLLFFLCSWCHYLLSFSFLLSPCSQ